MLSAKSHTRIQTERALVDIVKWLRRRWVSVKQAGGFNNLQGWSLKELSHGERLWFPSTKVIFTQTNSTEIEISIDDLLNSEMPGRPPHKPIIINRRNVLEGPDSDPIGTGIDGVLRDGVVSPTPHPVSGLSSPGLSLAFLTQFPFSMAHNNTEKLTKSETVHSHASNDPRDHVNPLTTPVISQNSVIQKMPMLGAGPKVNTSASKSTDLGSRPQSPVSTASEGSSAFETASDGSLSVKNWNLDTQSTKDPATSNTSTITMGAAQTLIRCPHPVDKRISLITVIFSNSDEINMVNHLCRDDTQTFVDVIDEVLICSFIQGDGPTDLELNCPPLVDIGCTGSMAPEKVSGDFAQDMWPFRFDPKIHTNPTLL